MKGRRVRRRYDRGATLDLLVSDSTHYTVGHWILYLSSLAANLVWSVMFMAPIPIAVMAAIFALPLVGVPLVEG